VKRFPSTLITLFLVLGLAGCATVMTGMTSSSYRGGSIVLTYSNPEVIRDQSQVATIIVPQETYGLIVDGVLVKELEGGFNSALRRSRSGNEAVYIVDLLPGTHKLTVTYDSMKGSGNMTGEAALGSSSSLSVSAPSPFSWLRTSETTHNLKGGEIYVIGLKLMTASGAIDLYPLSAGDHSIIIETRNSAQF